MIDAWFAFYNWFCQKADDVYWHFMHRFHPKYKYYMIDTGLTPGYYDPDQRMFHGCFNLLKEYVESFDIDKHIASLKEDLEEDPKDRFVEAEISSYERIRELYIWWTEIRPNREEPEWVDCGSGELLCNCLQCNEFFCHLNKLEDKHEKEDDCMMMRLMLLRRHIWY